LLLRQYGQYAARDGSSGIGVGVKAKEATARIKINRLLDEAGWRFFDDANGPANIVLEPNTKITETQIDELGNDFETTKNGFIDFLLLDREGKPLIVLEAKSEGKNPLAAKEQARRYAREQNARFVILSNGNIHYLWDLKQGNPSVITKFPSTTLAEVHFLDSQESLNVIQHGQRVEAGDGGSVAG